MFSVFVRQDIFVLAYLSCCSNSLPTFVQSAIHRLLFASYRYCLLSSLSWIVMAYHLSRWKTFCWFFPSEWTSIFLADVKSFTLMLSFSATLAFFSSMPLFDYCFLRCYWTACVFPVKNKHHDEYWYHQLVKVKLKYFCFRSFDVLTGLPFETSLDELNKRIVLLIWKFWQFVKGKTSIYKD